MATSKNLFGRHAPPPECVALCDCSRRGHCGRSQIAIMGLSMRKSQQIRSVAAAVAVLALSACGQKAPQGGAMPPPEVGVVTVTPSAVAVVNELPGRLEGVRTA